ncbi:sensor histidine kinase [Actinomadura geliboluensis]|uniref:histidine kinase n=1 Tax=Actinomadura geliboluensis TaxID=882440 RepID=A0A5S4H4A6_9ACTN|nr:ATP-binding protein [Actinomadura geliboluensis]TMR40073.1 hypothetical protein ETD96_12750 [Actinomadura geliboluensis]
MRSTFPSAVRHWPLALITTTVAASTGATVLAVTRSGEGGVVFPAAVIMLTSAFFTSGMLLAHQRPSRGLGLLLIVAGLTWPLRLLDPAGQGAAHELTLLGRALPAPLAVGVLLAFPEFRLADRLERATVALTLLLPLTLYADYHAMDRSRFEPCLSCVSMGWRAEGPVAVLAHAHVVAVAVLVVLVLVRRWSRSCWRRELYPAWTLGILIGLHLAIEPLLPYLLPFSVTGRLRLPLNAAAVALQVLLAITVAGGLLRMWLARNATKLDTLRRAAEAQVDQVRRRLQRDLHDGAQFRMLNAMLAVQIARDHLPAGGAGEARAQLDSAAAELQRALEELRRLSRGRRPALLQRGLDGALRELAEAAPLPVTLTGQAPAGLDVELSATAYFLVAEGLTNAVRHARARAVTVSLRQRGGTLRVSVEDDGIGQAAPDGRGLSGLAERVSAIGGTFDVVSTAGQGTSIIGEFSCASSSPTTRS